MIESFLELANTTVSIRMFRNRMKTLRDPLKTLRNMRTGNVSELTHLPIVKPPLTPIRRTIT